MRGPVASAAINRSARNVCKYYPANNKSQKLIKKRNERERMEYV